MSARRWLALLLAALLAFAAACASRSYAPRAPGAVGLFERLQTQEQGGVTVRAAVPSEAETEAIFGLPLYRRGIQPIWLEVTNTTRYRYRYAPVGTDAQYYSPYEVAYMHKRRYKGDAYREMEQALHEGAMPRWIWPGETRSGWVFTHVEPGTKAFNVDLFQGAGGDLSLGFFIEVPGRTPDHAAIDFMRLYGDDAVTRVDLDGLRPTLSALICCPSDVTGKRSDRPFNVVLVGPGRSILVALLRAGFYERPRSERPEHVELEPHFDGRPPDAVFRTRRSGAGDRNELRVWRAPIEVEGDPVWLGQMSHYVGQSSEIARAFFDDRLDPNLGDGRDFMLQTMWYAQSLERYAWQRVRAANGIGEPYADFRGRIYFWDGMRAVLWLSAEPISQTETSNLGWDDPPVTGTR